VKVIDKGSIHIYDPKDECPHRPGPQQNWQESMVLYAFDTERQVYLFMRVSQEPNVGPGFTTCWLNVWTPDYIYKRTDDAIPRKSGDVGDNFIAPNAGLARYEFRGDGKHHWSLDDAEIQVRVVLHDYHPGFGYYDESAGFLLTDVCPSHVEATGWVTGSVTLKGKTYEIAGPGWRDHSWGPRDWGGVLVHRFYPALFGRDFNFFCVMLIGKNGTKGKFGTVIQNDTVQAANDFDVVVYTAEDGVSNLGGRITLRLNGATHILEYDLLAKPAISFHRGLACVDAMCRVRMGDRIGVGVAETTHRAQGGDAKPFIFPDSPGILESGVFPNASVA
jgi:hypothetical protein